MEHYRLSTAERTDSSSRPGHKAEAKKTNDRINQDRFAKTRSPPHRWSGRATTTPPTVRPLYIVFDLRPPILRFGDPVRLFMVRLHSYPTCSQMRCIDIFVDFKAVGSGWLELERET